VKGRPERSPGGKGSSDVCGKAEKERDESKGVHEATVGAGYVGVDLAPGYGDLRGGRERGRDGGRERGREGGRRGTSC
jgi:hypothetical protein